MKIWHVWSAEDPAESDAFFPTKGEAMAHTRETYGATKFTLIDDQLVGYPDDGGDGYEVYVVAEGVEPTRAGICSALKYIPNR